MCILRLLRHPVCQVHFGLTLMSFWVHCGVILGSLCCYFGLTLVSFWFHFGIIMGSLGTAIPLRGFSRGYRRSLYEALPALPLASLSATLRELPDEIDWSVNATTPVRDQGKCESSWAFATIAGVESAIFNRTGEPPPSLSGLSFLG